MPVDFGLSFDFLAEAISDAFRALIPRIDQTDDVIAMQRRERVIERCARRFGCESAAPELAPDRPSELVFRPPLGAMKSDAPHQAMGRELLDTPHAVAAQMPMTDDRRHVLPRVAAGHWFACGEPGHFKVGVNLCVLLEIARFEHPQSQAWRA